MKDKILHIVLDNVKYNNNIGPIFRVADALQVEKIWICRENPEKITSYKREVMLKSSRGALNYINWDIHLESYKVVKELKEKGFQIISVDINGQKYADSKDLIIKHPVALVFGSEKDGINKDILEISDEILKIPMYGKVPSLNVASSVAILTYKIRELGGFI